MSDFPIGFGGGTGVTSLVDADTLSAFESFCFVFCRFSCLSSSMFSGVGCDELCFDFLSPPPCFLFKDCELDGVSVFFLELLSCFEALGVGRGGASVISSSSSSSEDSGREAGFLKDFGVASVSSSEVLSVLLPSTESESIFPG